MTDVTGSWRRFAATAGTTRPDEVWRLWTTPATWGRWDRGLRSAHLDGPFRVGARGDLWKDPVLPALRELRAGPGTGPRGHRSRFTVAAVDPGRRCAVHVALPGARMGLTRSLDGGTLRHEVALTGPLGPLWALLLGRGSRRLLGPTVDALVELAEGRGSPSAQPMPRSRRRRGTSTVK